MPGGSREMSCRLTVHPPSRTACVFAVVEWEEKGLADWLWGGFSEAGGADWPAVDGDDALVLEMLARPWPLNIDKYANSCCP